MSGEIQRLHDLEMWVETRGEGEPLLLLHGFGGSSANWEPLFERPPEGYRLIAPDLRGHGRSTNPSGRFSFHRCALDLAALLDRLAVERCRAIGVSGGAQTLLHLATLADRESEVAGRLVRLDAMVLVSTAPYFPAEARAIMDQLTVESRSEEDWRQMRQWHPGGDEQIRAL